MPIRGIRSRSSVLLMVLAVGLAPLVSIPKPAAAQVPLGSIVVATTPAVPVPYQPLTVHASVTGCPDFSSGGEVRRANIDGDLLDYLPDIQVTETSSGENYEFEVTIPVAYPGSWLVNTACADPTEFVVANPLVATFTPSVVFEATATQVSVQGSGCPGRSVRWGFPNLFGGAPYEAALQPDGTFAGSAMVKTRPLTDLFGSDAIVYCVFDNGVLVRASFSVSVLPSPPPTTILPPVVNPRFTG